MNRQGKFIVFGIAGAVLLIVVVSVISSLVRPFDRPEYVEITPSQTAFVVPLEGQTSAQGKFMSEEFLQNAKVASKRIRVTHRWSQEGRWPNNGKWIPSVQVIVVERKPETREWTEKEGTGTSAKDEGIVAESVESIGFMSRWNCSAQIDEPDAVRFLYRYNNKPLAEVMDTEVRARVAAKFVEECAKRDLTEVIKDKASIVAAVRKDVVPYFKDRGINITVLGLTGEFTYANPKIQEAIDAKFTAARLLEAQRNINDRITSEARATATAARTLEQSGGLRYQLRKMELENQKAAIEAWKGGAQMPTVVGGSGTIFQLPMK